MQDRRAPGLASVGSLPVKIVVEDRSDRAVAQRADIDGAGGCGLDTLHAEWLDQSENAETGAKALLGMRTAIEDKIAQGGGGGTDEACLLADASDGPIGIATMARGHMLGNAGVATIAARAQMGDDALPLGEDRPEPASSRSAEHPATGLGQRNEPLLLNRSAAESQVLSKSKSRLLCVD